MARAVSGALSDADLVAFVTDVEKPFGAADESILKMLRKPSLFVVNKIDKIKNQSSFRYFQPPRDSLRNSSK